MSAFYSFEDILLAGLMFLIFSHLLRDYMPSALFRMPWNWRCQDLGKCSFVAKDPSALFSFYGGSGENPKYNGAPRASPWLPQKLPAYAPGR
jgi:hypothetical protein